MSTVRINNHMDRVLPLRRPYAGGKAGLVLPMTAFNSQTVVIPPHKSADIDFWDDIKNHPIYQNYLDRGKISVGAGRDPKDGDGDPYTSFGDTMEAADSLNPEIDDDEAEEVQMRLERGEDKPKKRRTRRAEPKTNADETDKADEAEQDD